MLYMIAYQSALISRKLPCPKNFLVMRLLSHKHSQLIINRNIALLFCEIIDCCTYYVDLSVNNYFCFSDLFLNITFFEIIIHKLFFATILLQRILLFWNVHLNIGFFPIIRIKFRRK